MNTLEQPIDLVDGHHRRPFLLAAVRMRVPTLQRYGLIFVVAASNPRLSAEWRKTLGWDP